MYLGEHALCVKKSKGDILLICLYVDDMIFIKNNYFMIKDFKLAMKLEFEMTDFGLMSYFLGIEVIQATNRIFMYHKRYATEILKKFKIFDCSPVHILVEVGTKLSKVGDSSVIDLTYFKNTVGSLRYLTYTRLDIIYGVGLVSKFMEVSKHLHLHVVKRIL